jgi:hypothetical protein
MSLIELEFNYFKELTNMGTLKSNARSIGLILTFGSILLLPTLLTPAPSQAAPKTTFACVKKDADFATVARRGDRETKPMILWTDKTWGKYTPEKRCQIVSQRLTKAVAISGKLSNLNMTHGKVNSAPVICYVTTKDGKCNADNILFSLKPADVGNEQAIVDKLLNFSKVGSGDILKRGGAQPTPAEPATPQPKPESYGAAIEQALDNPNSTGPGQD